MLARPRLILWIFLLVAFSACDPVFHAGSATYNYYRLDSSFLPDPVVENVVKPYGDKINAQMQEIVGLCETTLEKKQPEGSLGNFMTDAMLAMAKVKFKTHVDAAFVNSGGIRLNQLAAGQVTRGKIFELMPFDNLLLIQKVKGKVLKEFLDYIAARGGWPVAGLSMQISNKKAVNVKIGGVSLDEETYYTIANSDYIINGGDGMNLLRDIPVQNEGYLIRDALFDYIKQLQQEGKNISAKEENRVSHAQ